LRIGVGFSSTPFTTWTVRWSPREEDLDHELPLLEAVHRDDRGAAAGLLVVAVVEPDAGAHAPNLSPDGQPERFAAA